MAIDGLAERIDQRLEVFRVVQGSEATQQATEQKYQRVGMQLDNLVAEVRQAVREFDELCQQPNLPTDIGIPANFASSNIAVLNEWLEQTATLPESWAQAIAQRQGQEDFVATLRNVLQTYTANLQSQRELEALLPKLRRTLEIVTEERKRFTDEVLDRIAQEVGRLYDAVHPGEGLNTVILGLDPKRRASLDIKTTFAGQHNVPPQAYYSESHLDTLGICIFLAIAGLGNAQNTILVLDDVLASVDEPHIDRLVDVLYEEAGRFRHCLITTHYRPWKEKYRWGRLRNNDKCHFVELSRWSGSDGMTRVQSVPEIERLHRLLKENPPDAQLVCSKAGLILEAALDFLTHQYGCSLSRKRDARYTIGELLSAINGRLLAALRVEQKIGVDDQGKPVFDSISLAPILKDIGQLAQARNTMGCHFNEIAHHMPDGDALAFGQKVYDLINVLVDPDVGWPEKNKSGSYWSNAAPKDETRRLYPLLRPS